MSALRASRYKAVGTGYYAYKLMPNCMTEMSIEHLQQSRSPVRSNKDMGLVLEVIGGCKPQSGSYGPATQFAATQRRVL